MDRNYDICMWVSKFDVTTIDMKSGQPKINFQPQL